MADKKLFTPGPLTTSPTVKEAMLTDLGSRDFAMIETVRAIRSELLAIGGVSQAAGWEAVIVQGSGTFGVESTIGSAVPSDGRLLVLANGAYGERIANMAGVLHIDCIVFRCGENETHDPRELDAYLEEYRPSHVALVHSETTSGLFNPIEILAKIAKNRGATVIVDAMSSFGGVPIDLSSGEIDFLVSSSNKCIEGVPGFSFVLAKRDELLKTKGRARSLSLDLFAQWEGLEKNGQFRFTPPTHALLAFRQALRELADEGGVTARAARYSQNHEILMDGMAELGFKAYLSPENRGYIINTFYLPDSPNFRFDDFYRKLNERGFVIYPGKLTKADCFRIGNIGQLFPADMRALLAAIEEVCRETGV